MNHFSIITILITINVVSSEVTYSGGVVLSDTVSLNIAFLGNEWNLHRMEEVHQILEFTSDLKKTVWFSYTSYFNTSFSKATTEYDIAGYFIDSNPDTFAINETYLEVYWSRALSEYSGYKSTNTSIFLIIGDSRIFFENRCSFHGWSHANHYAFIFVSASMKHCQLISEKSPNSRELDLIISNFANELVNTITNPKLDGWSDPMKHCSDWETPKKTLKNSAKYNIIVAGRPYLVSAPYDNIKAMCSNEFFYVDSAASLSSRVNDKIVQDTIYQYEVVEVSSSSTFFVISLYFVSISGLVFFVTVLNLMYETHLIRQDEKLNLNLKVMLEESGVVSEDPAKKRAKTKASNKKKGKDNNVGEDKVIRHEILKSSGSELVETGKPKHSPKTPGSELTKSSKSDNINVEDLKSVQSTEWFMKSTSTPRMSNILELEFVIKLDDQRRRNNDGESEHASRKSPELEKSASERRRKSEVLQSKPTEPIPKPHRFSKIERSPERTQYYEKKETEGQKRNGDDNDFKMDEFEYLTRTSPSD